MQKGYQPILGVLHVYLASVDGLVGILSILSYWLFSIFFVCFVSHVKHLENGQGRYINIYYPSKDKIENDSLGY